MRHLREAIDNFPSRPDLDALIDSGDIVEISSGYQADRERTQSD